MSSYIILQKADAIHFIVDGASYDQDGVVRAIDSKTFHLPNAGSSFVLRGAAYAGPQAAAFLSMCISFDQVVELLPTIMRLLLRVRDATAQTPLMPIDRHFEIAVGGWSDRFRRMTAVIATTFEARDQNDPEGLSYWTGYEQFMPFMAPAGYLMPPVNMVQTIGREIASAEALETIDPVDEGLLLIEAQRNVPTNYNGQIRYLVGGFAELTTITRESIESTILCEWDDQIGSLIVPDGAPTPEELAAYSPSASPVAKQTEPVSCAA